MPASPILKSRNSRAAPCPALIVNADDFGLSRGVNAGIGEACARGILTSATLLANAPAFDDAVRVAGEHAALGVGVHLNLVRGRPLSRPADIPLLVGPDGLFRRFRLGRLTPAFLVQAGAEYRLQIEKILAAGIRPTHIDFEKHHAWQGPLYRLACGLAAECGIGAARTLREPVAWAVRAMGGAGVARVAMACSLRAGFDLGGGGRCALARPDRLLGQLHIGDMTEEVWLRLARNVPAGISEVMTHPGSAEPDAGDDGMGGSWLAGKRGIELAALLSPRVREALDAACVRLIHFGDLIGLPRP